MYRCFASKKIYFILNLMVKEKYTIPLFLFGGSESTSEKKGPKEYLLQESPKSPFLHTKLARTLITQMKALPNKLHCEILFK